MNTDNKPVANPVANAFGAFVASAEIAKQATAPVVAPVKAKTVKTTTATKAKSTPAIAMFSLVNHPLQFIVRDGSGAAKLFAHTAAWLDLTGLIRGESYPADIIRELGGSAYSNHTRLGNFTESQGMASLTPQGLTHFRARDTNSAKDIPSGKQKYLIEDKEHYMLMMMEGVNDARLVRSELTVKKISAKFPQYFK